MNLPTLLRPAIVLVTPREEGNVGAVARAMANLGLEELILVEPAPPIAGTARGFGIGGWSILDRARRVPDLAAAVAPFQLAIGTTSGRGRPLPRRRVLDVRQLADALREAAPPASRVAVVFGPEDNGLTRDHLDRCEPLVTIPCDSERPTLNLAQAVLLIAWELHRARLDPPSSASNPPAEPTTWADREIVLDIAEPVVHDLGFDHDHLHASVLRDLRRLLERAAPDRRETALLRRLVERARARLGASSSR